MTTNPFALTRPWLAVGAAALFPLLLAAETPAPAPATPGSPPTGKPFTEVAHFDPYQVTGIAVSKTGRLFANFPLWTDDYKYAVVEVLPDGATKPYPDERWNSWRPNDPDTAGKFVCVQSVVADDAGSLWVLDPASPYQKGTVPGGPKLVKIDLATNRVVQTIAFGVDVCPPKSYLNDVRFDLDRQVAYITESGVGAIVVVDLKTGQARRTLDQDPSVLLEKNVDLVIEGKEVKTAEGKKPEFNVDGIALSPDRDFLYYQALMGTTLYRVPTAVLRDPGHGAREQSQAVEKVATTFPADGFWMDAAGNLYLSDLQGNAVRRRTPDGNVTEVAADPRIQWPDSFAQGPDGSIYFSCSQIHHLAKFNGGRSTRTTPYFVYKVMP